MQIVASYTAGYWENAYSPFIKFQLQNTKVDFTLRAKENRETKSFNAINILESANQVETLKGEIFTKLTIDGSQSLSLDQTVIKMEIEFED